jgi:hypothetical protein
MEEVMDCHLALHLLQVLMEILIQAEVVVVQKTLAVLIELVTEEQE